MAAGSLPGIVRVLVVAVLAIGAFAGAAPALAVDCSGLSEWSCSTSYGLGASVRYNGSKYTLCAACSRAASCPGFAPDADNWWTNNGTCDGGTSPTPTPTPTPTNPPSATPTPTPTSPGPTATPSPTPTIGPGPTATPTPTTPPGGDVEVTPGSGSVTASTNDGNVPGNTVDNSLSTRWSANGDGHWIKYDLGTSRTITRVRIGFYSGNTRQSRFDLQVSADNTTWTNVLTGAMSGGTTTQQESFDFADTSGRWVRYLGHGNTVNAWNSILELDVHATSGGGPTPTPTPTTGTQPTATPTPTPATATPTPTATPTGGPGRACAAGWSSGTSYAQGTIVSRQCTEGRETMWRNYKSNFGGSSDPCSDSWLGGTGWSQQGTCGSSFYNCTSGTCLLFNQDHFDRTWPLKNYWAVGKRADTYTWKEFRMAADQDAMFTTGDTNMRKREVAAYFANKDQETGIGQYDREIYCQPGNPGFGTVNCNYCSANTECGTPKCSTTSTSGNKYFGRGPVQLSWDYNYCRASKAIWGDNRLYDTPDLMFSDPVAMWRVANWYWKTQIGPTYPECTSVPPGHPVPQGCPNLVDWPRESARDAMTTTDASGNYGFGGTIRAINGALECHSGNTGQTNRIAFYAGGGGARQANMLDILGVTGSARVYGRDTCD